MPRSIEPRWTVGLKIVTLSAAGPLIAERGLDIAQRRGAVCGLKMPNVYEMFSPPSM